jgi:hypothetical protein
MLRQWFPRPSATLNERSPTVSSSPSAIADGERVGGPIVNTTIRIKPDENS